MEAPGSSRTGSPGFFCGSVSYLVAEICYHSTCIPQLCVLFVENVSWQKRTEDVLTRKQESNNNVYRELSVVIPECPCEPVTFVSFRNA